MRQQPSNLPRSLGGYRLVERIGAGGMGAVFRAEDPRTQTTVAVKVIHEHLRNDSYVGRFRNEAHLASLMTSPYIVRVIEFGIDNGEYFLVTEFVQGTKLADLIAAGLSVVQSLAIATEMAMALQAASVLSVVHRDIKPDNIIVTPDGSLKLMDFGIARLSYVETQQLFMGTVSYAAPEQFQGQTDGRSDMYSLGVVMFQMVTGELPFPSDSLPNLMRLQQEATLPLEKLPGPESLRKLIATCIDKEPNRRYQTPSELLVALHEVRRQLTSTSDDTWLADTMLTTVAGFQSLTEPATVRAQPVKPEVPVRPPLAEAPESSNVSRHAPLLVVAGVAAVLLVIGVFLWPFGGNDSKRLPGIAAIAETPVPQSSPIAAPAPVPDTWRRFSSSGLELSLPPGYQGGEPAFGAVEAYAASLRSLGLVALASTMEFVKPNLTHLIFSSDVLDQGTNVNVTRFPNSTSQSLDALTDQQAHNLVNANFRIVERTNLSVGGMEARRIRAEITSIGGVLSGVQYLFKKGDVLWIVSYNTTQQVYERLRSTFEQSAQSVRISN